jgi:hypothetical protein
LDPLFPTGGADQATDPNVDYADQLVGEGKRYKDLAALARAKVESDAFIERLKTENAAQREALKGEQKLDEFFDKLKSTLPTPGTPSTPVTNPGEQQPNQSPNPNNNQALSPEDVLKLMDKRDQVTREQRNLETAVSKVQEVFGANYKSVMAQKAADLGMAPEALVSLAKTQPQAFLKLVEADKAPSNSGTAPPRSSVNTNSFTANPSQARDKKHYDALRKQMGDRKFFSNREVQNQMHKDAQEQREAFYK